MERVIDMQPPRLTRRPTDPAPTAIVVGNRSLLVRCAEVLQGRGVVIRAAVSEDAAIQRWADAAALRCRPFARAPGDLPRVDYLFSIGNEHVLPGEWLALATTLAANFHDGPLPALAGLHATSWALLRGEARHAVVWHVATGDLDGGDLLEQEWFDIEPGDTAVTLNARCFEAGVVAFERLVDALLDGKLSATAQVGQREYFGRRRRPRAAGYADPSLPIETRRALVRALEFGPYENPLCTPWRLDGDRVVRLLTPDAVAPSGGPALEPDLADRLTDLHARWCLDERAWVERGVQLRPLELPAQPGSRSATRQSLTAGVPAPSLSQVDLVAATLLWLAREFDSDHFDVGYRGPALDGQLARLERWFESLPPLRVQLEPTTDAGSALGRLRQSVEARERDGTFLRDLVHRYAGLRGLDEAWCARRLGVALVAGSDAGAADDEASLVIHVDARQPACVWHFDEGRWPAARIAAMQRRWTAFVATLEGHAATPWRRVPLLTERDRQLLSGWSGTATAATNTTIVDEFAAQVRRRPDAEAVVSGSHVVTYAALARRVEVIAAALIAHGTRPGDVVALLVDRSADMVASLLAILRTGAAYLPLDEAYPPERTRTVVADAGATRMLTTRRLAGRVPGDVHALLLDGIDDERADSTEWPRVQAGDLAYVIYTSGSTGTPKGVAIEHRYVTAFFAAMDGVIDHDPPGTWLAVTSLAFDIAVLELLWPLCRGFRVIVHEGAGRLAARPSPPRRRLGFSLFYFAADERTADHYSLLLEGAKFADAHGFEAVWTPERHFHAFGGPFPNPAVTGAAVAAVTTRVHVRAGSLVLPLHHPVRAAEDWAVVDVLSRGRVGVSFASGWHPNDFVLAPANHSRPREALYDDIALVQRLWRGEQVELPGPSGTAVAVRTLPRPVQPELPSWLTAAGNPETFRRAGELGLNILTHLLGQTLDELAQKLSVYREARRAAGHAGPGHVTLMVHTFVGRTTDEAREITRGPLRRYLATSFDLLRQHAWSFPAFRRAPADRTVSTEDLLRGLSRDDHEALLDHAFERYFEGGGLLGSVDRCVAAATRLAELDVDEVACMIDFGVDRDTVLAGLERLDEVRARLAGDPAGAGDSMAAALQRWQVSHLQCTPSVAAMLLADADAAPGLRGLTHWLIGGEPLPAVLAARARQSGAARVTNMYGPTETTVWSLSHDVGPGDDPVPIGRPLENTRVYVLDGHGEASPPGAVGEVHLGGRSVAREYWRREALTAERFLQDPFAGTAGARMYRTGDRARFGDDGRLEFIGRSDDQVKIRGIRLELGEVASVLQRVPGILDAVAVVHDVGPGDQRLIAYVTTSLAVNQAEAVCRQALSAWLIDGAVPSSVEIVDALPRLPNGKLDRPALRRRASAPAPAPGAPAEGVAATIAAVWSRALGTEVPDLDRTFFELGGHSLLAVEVARQLSSALGRELHVIDIFRFPSVRALARHLDAGETSESLRQAVERAGQRRRRFEQRARPEVTR